ncbi:hypothetical protein [Brachybacterium sp. FME24]|uniref:hypothetical protein n=1 Tax=Brachybacterium sp. FME24 TaxID=2742605 RepID=UPI0018689418|nr:hypothetical protein [Brachybacterium sp. FME24]
MSPARNLEATCVRAALALAVTLAATGAVAAASGRQQFALVIGLFELDVVWIAVLGVSAHLYRHNVRIVAGWRDIARAVTPEPVRRVILTEVRALVSLGRVALRRPPQVPHHATPVRSRHGTVAIPVAFGVLTLVEVTALHVVLPWPELSAALTLLSIYALLLLLGVVASRWDHPHYVTAASLVLRNGSHVVADLPWDAISTVAIVRDGSVTAPAIDTSVARLATLDGCSLAVELSQPCPVALTSGRRARVQTVHEIRFAADDAQGVLELLESRRG